MKIKKQNIIPLLLLLFLQVIIIIGAWNLKLGLLKAFYFILIAVILSFILIILLFLIFSEVKMNFNFSFKKKTKEEFIEKAEVKTEKKQVHREFTDPKSTAEQIFKNVLLKRNMKSFGEKLLQNLAYEFDGIQGIFYLFDKKENVFKSISSYAMHAESVINKFAPGEGIPGQASTEEKITILANLPEKYRGIHSGLGDGEPSFMYFIPFYYEKKCIALIELSTFKEIPQNRITVLNFLIQLGAKKITQFRDKING